MFTEAEVFEDLRKNVGRLSLSSFSIQQVLKHGYFLMASDDSCFSRDEQVPCKLKLNYFFIHYIKTISK